MGLPAKLLRHCFACLAAPAILLAGCGTPPAKSTLPNQTSIAKLSQALPNLKAFGLESCSYTLEKTSAASRLPSPADMRVEIKGSARLSAAGAAKLKSAYVWTSVDPAGLPQSLRGIAPEAKLLACPQCNESFFDNPTFAHGLVVLVDDGTSSQIYFLATDRDHPME